MPRRYFADSADRHHEILTKAEGNPLFIEEIAKVLTTHLGQGDETASASPMARVPDTIEQIFLARLDEVEPRSRRIAQEAAVVGRAFPDDLLAAVTDNPAWIASSLRQLEREELLRYWEPQMSSEGHEFTHFLTWNTIYESLLIRRRAELHLQTAAAIERMFRTRWRVLPRFSRCITKWAAVPI